MKHEIPFGNSNRENGPTFLDFPLFLGIFQWDEPTKRVPFTAEPEIPEILTKWKAPNVLPDQFQMVAAILASGWCQKNTSFLAPIRRHCPQGLFWLFVTFLRALFFHPFRLSLAPTICPWVSKDENDALLQIVMVNSGTHLMKNCDSQCRTNESQLKKNEP